MPDSTAHIPAETVIARCSEAVSAILAERERLTRIFEAELEKHNAKPVNRYCFLSLYAAMAVHQARCHGADSLRTIEGLRELAKSSTGNINVSAVDWGIVAHWSKPTDGNDAR